MQANLKFFKLLDEQTAKLPTLKINLELMGLELT